MQPRIAASIAAVAALAGLALFGNPIADYFWPGWRYPVSTNGTRAPVLSLDTPACDLNQGACSARLPDGSQLRLEITPRPLVAMQPLKVRLDIATPAGAVPALRAASLALSGINMDMGINQQAFVLLDSRAGHSSYTLQTSLPVCTRTTMLWRAELDLEKASPGTSPEGWRLSWRFTTNAPR